MVQSAPQLLTVDEFINRYSDSDRYELDEYQKRLFRGDDLLVASIFSELRLTEKKSLQQRIKESNN